MFVGRLYVFFGKMFIQILCPIFKLDCLFAIELYDTSFLCILDINPLSDTWFAKISSHSVGCLFILLMIFFAVQKLKSQYFIMKMFKHTAKFGELYSEPPVPTSYVLQLLTVCYISFITLSHIYSSTHQFLFFDAFQNKLWTSLNNLTCISL